MDGWKEGAKKGLRDEGEGHSGLPRVTQGHSGSLRVQGWWTGCGLLRTTAAALPRCQLIWSETS
jgi:hypothetical protein